MIAWRPPRGHLAALVAAAAEDCASRKRERPGLSNEVRRARPSPRGFARALRDGNVPGFPLICEVKRASPSAGAIQVGADAPAQARAYVAGGARCVSVLTEGRRFGGALADLAQVRAEVSVPLLRKDFVVDPYMVEEAAAFGADAILLIAGALEPSRLAELAACARELGLDVLLELIHPHEEEALGRVATPLVGVNARDLETLHVDPDRFGHMVATLRLAAPDRLLVAESGIRSPQDVARFRREGAGAALVGEALMRAPDPTALVRALAEAPP